MPAESEAQALADALGKSTEPALELKGQTVPVAPLCINQIADIMLSIDRLAEKGVPVASLLSGDSEASISYTQLVLRGGRDFIAILATASNQTPDFVGSLNVLELAKLAGAVWKVNKDFFAGNQIEILQAFGLDQTHVATIKNTFDSIKSLVTSEPTGSPTSEVSPSKRSSPSPAASPDENAAP